MLIPKRCSITGVLALAGLLLAIALPISSAQAEIIYSNLGSDDTYSHGAFSIAGPTSFRGRTEITASAFTPSSNAKVGLIELGLGVLDPNTGTNRVLLSLVADSGELPTGTVLASTAVTGLPETGLTFTTLTGWDLAGSVELTAGQTYWVIGTPGADDTAATWSVGLTPGTLGATKYADQPWSYNEAGAMRVNGFAVVVPEVSTLGLSLVPILLVGSVWLRRRVLVRHD